MAPLPGPFIAAAAPFVAAPLGTATMKLSATGSRLALGSSRSDTVQDAPRSSSRTARESSSRSWKKLFQLGSTAAGLDR
ncbi:hypothetical protein TSH64_31490 [Azospirillum sp. TSH64]|nr:hypothetical protein TSH64_31490 [Azospirillum sp. TSH64]